MAHDKLETAVSITERNEKKTSWFVAQTLSRKEKVAQQNLENQDMPTFLPLIRSTRRRKGRFVTQLLPLFPGYIFVGIEIGGQRWRSVNGTIGVARLLTDKSGPVPVPEGFVDRLIGLTGPDHVFKAASQGLAVGQGVAFRSGPFSGSEGTILTMSGTERVRVLLKLLGREVEVDSSVEHLALS